MREVLSGYFELARSIVGRYGGVVQKFIGDAVMAVWGAPAAKEDDAERAVRAALELASAVASLAVAGALASRGLPLVVDPVMVASSGSRLLREDAVKTLVTALFPLATVLTPNLPEAQALTGLRTEDRAVLAEGLAEMGAPAVLVTGGHGAYPEDHLFDGSVHLSIPVHRYPVAATHGAGCTHSAALAAGLAAGLPELASVSVVNGVATLNSLTLYLQNSATYYWIGLSSEGQSMADLEFYTYNIQLTGGIMVPKSSWSSLMLWSSPIPTLTNPPSGEFPQ